MSEYHVNWEIEVEADSPREAAEEAHPMSGYQTQFSFVVQFDPGDEGARAAGIVMTYDVAVETDLVRALIDCDDPEPMGLPLLEAVPEGVWIHDDGGEADTNILIEVVRWLLAQDGAPEYVTFEWASTCTKPQLDSFHGGAAIVHKDWYRAEFTGDLVDRLWAERDELALEALDA